jgi:hypothetical protein
MRRARSEADPTDPSPPGPGSSEKHRTSSGPREDKGRPAPGTVAGVPFIITRRIRADLIKRGYTEVQIKGMTPTQALARLGHTIACPGCGAAVPLDALCHTRQAGLSRLPPAEP